MTSKQNLAAKTTKPAGRQNFRKRPHFRLLVAFFLSTTLLIGLLVLQRVMLPLYDDYELDLSKLTRATLNTDLIRAVAMLPLIVVSKELIMKEPWRARTDVTIIVLSVVVGLLAVWGVLGQIFFYDDSLYL